MSQFLSDCTASELTDAAANLLAGRLVAFPTETVYGLGADACNADAVAQIYSVKGRPSDHPLIVHVAALEALGDWAEEVPSYAISLARDFWPGPMTLVVRRSALPQDFLTGGQDTVGVRVPNHPVALGLLEAFAKAGGKGVAAPSANRFGNVSPTTAQAVLKELGAYLSDKDQVLDGGACEVGVESTIIDCTGVAPLILRPGAITSEMIFRSTGPTLAEKDSSPSLNRLEIRVSGSLESHYAPAAKVVLDRAPIAGEGFIAMADIAAGEDVVRLASPKSHQDFARVLYSALRSADEAGLATVVVMQPLGDGIAIAIRDRLKKSSGGR